MRPARPGGPGANLTLLTLYREPPDFEGEPNYSGISSSILDAGEPAILITDRKISALADPLPIFEKPPQQVTCRTAATSLGSAAWSNRQATSVGSATISTPRRRASSYSSGMIGS